MDKVGRAYSVQHLFADGLVWRPDTDWAQMVEDQFAIFPKGSHDDLCLVGETEIVTKRGIIPICNITRSDLVLTPIGWRRVLAAGFTGVRPVISVGKLTGTANHPVFTVDAAFTRLDTVISANQMMGLKLCDLMKTARLRKFFLKGLSTAEWAARKNTISVNRRQTTDGRTQKASTRLFGSLILGRLSRPAMKFITRTVTPLILCLAIWSAYRWVSIVDFLKTSTGTLLGKILDAFVLWRPRGIGLPKAELGTLSTPGTKSASHTQGLEVRTDRQSGCVTAIGAARNLNIDFGKAESALKNAAMSCVTTGGASKETPQIQGSLSTPTMRPVYNLTVEGAYCYYANGILVHNCDAAMQAITHLRRMGIAQRKDESHAAFQELMLPSRPKKSIIRYEA